MVAPQPGQAQGPLIHSTPPLVPTGRGRAFSIIPLFGRQNSLGERAHTPSTGRPSRPCKHESSRKLREEEVICDNLFLSISGMTFGRKTKLNKEKESGREAQRVAGVIVFSAQIR